MAGQFVYYISILLLPSFDPFFFPDDTRDGNESDLPEY